MVDCNAVCVIPLKRFEEVSSSAAPREATLKTLMNATGSHAQLVAGGEEVQALAAARVVEVALDRR